MTFTDFLEALARADECKAVTLSPGPFELKINQNDARAARLLLWLYSGLPENATLGDLEDILVRPSGGSFSLPHLKLRTKQPSSQ